MFRTAFLKQAVFKREGCSCVTCWYFILSPLFKGFCAYWILVCNVLCIWKPSESFGRLFEKRAVFEREGCSCVTCWYFIFPPFFKGFCAYWILVCNVPCIWKPSESFGRLFEKRAVFEREGCSCVTCWYFIFPPFFKGFCAYWILVCNVPCIWKPSEMFQAAFFEAGCF